MAWLSLEKLPIQCFEDSELTHGWAEFGKPA